MKTDSISRRGSAHDRLKPELQTLLLLMSIWPACAHPGHNLGAYGAAHIVRSPYHLATLDAAAILLWWAGRFIRHRLPRRFVQIGAAATIGGAALLWLA